MNQFERQLENFVVDLSLIDKDNSQQPDYEKLADYILSGSGWTTLQQTKKNKNDINFIFADKFNDLLLEYCSKLLLHLPSTSKYMSSNLSEAGYGSLNDFINISLDLFLKFHDGATKTIYDTNSPALMNFSDVLFNQSKQDKNVLSYFKFIYLKFLHKIYKNNFENMSKKYAGRNFQNFIKPQTALNKHFQEQFKIIAKSLSNSEDLKIFYTNLLVNYIYDFMILTGFSATKSHIANVSSIFSHLIALLDQVCEFVLDSLIKFELDDFKSIWKRLSQLLLELKDYRNKIEHNQSCLRKKHNSHECKKSIHGSNPRHNDITSVKSECVMKKIFIKMLTLLNSGEKSAFVFELVEKLGICNCTRLDEFIEENVGFKQGLILPILDYLFSLLTDSDTLVVKRRSIFFPLLVDNSLIELDQTSTNINEHLNKNIFKSIETILVQMSAKSLILVNYLTGGLKKFAKYVQINKEEKSENSINQTILYKYMIAEVFYMQKGMLKLLAEKDADETKSKLFNAVCGYIKEMLALIGSVELLNFDGSLLKASDSMLIKDCYTSSQEELEMNINKKFTDFMHKNSANIYELVDKLSKKYDHDLLDPMTICALMIKYKHDIHGENSTRHLCKSIIDTIDLNPNLFGNQSAILIILDLYIKSAIFRTALNDCQHFHLGLLNSFNLYFDSDPSEQNVKYIEILLDLLLSYFYHNRKKDLNEIYVCMRNKLDSNVSWLMVFFNVMIMSKVFKINQSVPSSQNLPNQEIYLNKNEQSIPNDYEGDSEVTTCENFQPKTSDTRYRFDFIFYPRVLEICLNYITHIKRQQRMELISKITTLDELEKFDQKYKNFQSTSLNFLKRLLYLIETSNYNLQLILNQNFRSYFIQLLHKPVFKEELMDNTFTFYQTELEIIEHTYDIMYHISSLDITASFLTNIFEIIVDNQFQDIILEKKHLSASSLKIISLLNKIKKLSANLVMRLSKNLNFVHCTNFVQISSENHQEPIDLVLKPSISKKWKINFSYQGSFDEKKKNSEENQPSKMNQIIRESNQKIFYFRVPISNENRIVKSGQQTSDFSHFSYSIGFMIRFDNNSINYSSNSNDSYMHLFSINLEDENSSFEIWLSQNGSILFIRRSNHSIIITFNLLQIEPHIWYFLYINYDEEQHIDKIKSKITYCVNAQELREKEFDIFDRHDKPILHHSKSINTNYHWDIEENLFFYIGHQEKKSEFSQMFNYDLGQVILSRDANYSIEHLILMMQIMDTNFSLIDQTSSYEWTYLNGYCDIKVLENIQKNFNEYTDQIKARTIVVYNPRYSHSIMAKPYDAKSLMQTELASNCKTFTQSTLDICLARIGGIEQILVLIAKLIDQEHKLYTALKLEGLSLEDNKNFDRTPSLLMLESLIYLVNKRAYIQSEFKKMDGYVLLQRIFTSIASLNKYLAKNQNYPQDTNYYTFIQKDLFIILVNGSFFKPVYRLNYYDPSPNNIEFCYENAGRKTQTKNEENVFQRSSINVINPEILSHLIIEWELWIPLENLEKKLVKTTCLYKFSFQILNKLLNFENKSQLYHSNLFLKYNLLEKLINFLLDANEENFILDSLACSELINIFKHFNSIFTWSSADGQTSSKTITKRLFSNFFDYLYLLHPESNVYIINQKNEFYFNLNKNLLNIEKSNNSSHRNSLIYLNQVKPLALIDSENEKFEKTTSNDLISNEKHFSNICSALMKIMTEMLSVLPDLMLNDILNLLKFESFIMFAMDENINKRFEAFKLFFELIDRSFTKSFFLASMASAVVNVAATTSSLSGQAVKSFEQQNFGINKDFLLYSMANQLRKFDQDDPRFMEFCISKIINQPFSFEASVDSSFLKSQQNHITTRQSYIFIFLSLVFSSRKKFLLCQNGLRFLTNLLNSDVVKIEFLITKAGLIQVMIELLKYFSDVSNLDKKINKDKDSVVDSVESLSKFPIINELKEFFCLVAGLLLKFSENQELELFGFFLNPLLNLCFDSASTEYELLNYNIKSIVLSIIRSVMAGLNSINVVQEASKSTFIIKKIIAPLMQGKSENQSKSTPMSQIYESNSFNMFQSDLVFQKLVVFVVDFLHIVYEKISDYPMSESAYNLDDELSIFSFSILVHSLSLGLENNQKGRFSNLFRDNLNILRQQFRRIFLFLLHPNHKLQTRLQIVKRLLNTTNCETLTKFVFSVSESPQSPLSYNIKLSYFMSQLKISNATRPESGPSSQAMLKNDTEILVQLNKLLIASGLNVKNDNNLLSPIYYQNPFSGYSETYFGESSSESSYLIVNLNKKKGTVDLSTQIDKEFYEEIINIYKQSQTSFSSFVNYYDNLAQDLSQYSCDLTNEVVTIHSHVRKMYFQRLKAKFIKSYDIKQKWIYLIENMTHEKCLLFDGNSWPQFDVLDQTEGPNRERRRLKKSHLLIGERYFKNEFKSKLKNETCSSPLKYLLNNYEDYLSQNQGDKKDSREYDSTFTANYMLSHWKNSEIISFPCPCKSVMPYCEITGQLLLTESRINFAADGKNYKYSIGMENLSYSWSYDDIKEIHLRRYLLKDVGIEIFLIFGQTILLAFSDSKDRNNIYKLITGKKLKNLNRTESIEEVTSLWKEAKISNYEYLMQLNKYSGRTFNDLMQYPIYPHILSNYSSDILDLSLEKNFRDLSKPIAIQYKEREEKFLENYRMIEEASNEPYHFASLYSNSGTVLHYLVRLPPFTKMFLDYQDQNFDVPDRTFHSMQTSWLLTSSVSTTDYKELVPEFFFMHEFLSNRQGFNFGLRQNGDPIDNVVLPSWSKSNPRLFIIIMRQALESNYVSQNIQNWIDLIWGFKQSGRPAIDAINCYHPACYFGYPVEQISDPVRRKAIETMIKTWGQTPKQLFTTKHPGVSSRQSNSCEENKWYNLDASSIHNKVINAKWGGYVGSLEQQAVPVCVWKENCKKNMIQLVGLASGEVVGLAQHKCLLIDRVKEIGPRGTENLPAVIEWAFFDDVIKVNRLDNEKSSTNLIYLRGNEQTVVCCGCIGASYLVVGMKSGLISVYKLRKDKNQILCDSLACNLYGHKQEIIDINVCLAFSTMVTCSQDLLIIWDTNKLSFVNSINLKNQLIYKSCISDTTNEIAFIGNNPNKLYFYTGNCEHIGEKDPLCDSQEPNQTVLMKSLCFSNLAEGSNVNVIGVGMSNGKIRLYSTWDLSLLREISINYDLSTMIGSIISLTFSRDGKRLYAADTYARVYILEAYNSPASIAKIHQSQVLSSINSILSTITVTTPNYCSNLVYFS